MTLQLLPLQPALYKTPTIMAEVESDSNRQLDQFLTYLDLEDCKDDLARIGVRSFEDLGVVDKKAMRLILPEPAIRRISAYYGKFATLGSKKNKYPSLKIFLEQLSLADAEADLKEKLKISSVEHLKFAKLNDLQQVVSKENAKRIMKAYKDLKNRTFTKIKEFGTRFMEMIVRPKNGSRKDDSSEKVLLNRTNAPSEPVMPIQETPLEAATETKRMETFDQHPSVYHSQINIEHYQQINCPDDDSICEPSAPCASGLSDTTSSSSDDDWIRFTAEEINQVRNSPATESCHVIPANPSNTSDIMPTDLDEKCCKDDSDSSVLYYFQSARDGDPWQYYDDVKIKSDDIQSVRYCLGSLSELSEEEICDALRFIHSEQKYSHAFYDRPSPACKSNAFVNWHYTHAARALILRYVYTVAIELTFNECLEVLCSSDWNLNNALLKIMS
nr:hypothetical transcript [Hymenolepis microstoma]